MFKKFLPLFLLILSFSTIHAQTVAYVTNQDSSSVSVIDTSTNTVTATIPVGSGPTGVVLTPDGTRAYVANTFSGTISVIDTASNTVVATIQIGGFGLAYPAITPDGKSVYAPNGGSVAVIDTASNSVVAHIAVPTVNPQCAVITPDGAHVYVAGLNSVTVLSTATNTVVTSIGVTTNGGPVAFPVLAMAPAGDAVYVAGGDNSSVTVISTASNSVVASIPTPQFVVPGLAVTPDGSKVYIAEISASGSGAGVVGIIDTATNTLEPAAIPFAPFPIAVAVTPDGAFVYVTSGIANTVPVISTATNSVVATVGVGGLPAGIAISNLSTPFSNLLSKGLTVNKKGFTDAGAFTLGANSTGIDLAHQPFTITVDNFSLTIPAGSFKQVGGNMHFVFSGTINGLPVSMTLIATGGTSTSFQYSITVNGVDLTGQPNPATVGLTIGANTGTTTAPF